jgi:hypothetical protein
MQSKEKLTTLCGFSREEATLDVSNQGLGPGDAVLIANDISDMRALTTLDISMNTLTRGALKAGQSGEYDHHYETDMTGMTASLGVFTSTHRIIYVYAGIIAVANAIKDMRAMTSLNLASNSLGTEGAKIVAAFLPKCT